MEVAVLEANALLSTHTLAALRIGARYPSTTTLVLEVFDLDWGVVMGTLEFIGTTYLQLPSSSQWGYTLSIVAATSAPIAALPSRGDPDGETTFEFKTFDGCESSFYVVATGLKSHHREVGT